MASNTEDRYTGIQRRKDLQSVLAQHSSHCLGYNLKYLVFFWEGHHSRTGSWFCN